MAEGTYEYECMRAELLGVAKPDVDDFPEAKECQVEEPEEELPVEELEEELPDEEEQLGRIAAGVDELNTIVQLTQRRISKFKASCGSLTNLLKIKLGHGSSESLDTTEKSADSASKSEDLLAKLDTIRDKTVKAHKSIERQNEEMDEFLN